MEKQNLITFITKAGNISLGVLFVVLLALPFIQNYFPLVPVIESTEKRQLATKPTFDITSLDGYPAKYESWYNDHFSLRHQLIRLKSLFSVKLFHNSPNPDKVIIGANNWLFMVRDELDTYRGTDLYSELQMDSVRNAFQYRKQYFEKQGIKVYVAILPTKYSIYSDKLPFYVNKVKPHNRTDQLIGLLEETGLTTIDLRKPLRENKGNERLYFKSDNHWNDVGAFYGSAAIIQRISQDFPEVKIPQLDDYNRVEKRSTWGNIAGLINMQEYFTEDFFSLELKQPPASQKLPEFGFVKPTNFEYSYLFELNYTTRNDSLPDILVIRDSFGNAMHPFFTEHFDTTVFIFDRWNYKLNAEIVETVKPDIVVYAILESLTKKGLLKGINEEITQPEH